MSDFFTEPKDPRPPYTPNRVRHAPQADVDVWSWLNPRGGDSGLLIPITLRELVRREYAAYGVTLSAAGVRARARGGYV